MQSPLALLALADVIVIINAIAAKKPNAAEYGRQDIRRYWGLRQIDAISASNGQQS